MNKPIILDLFSGCGGFGLGAELAGFESALAIDIDANLQSSYQLNFPNTHVLRGDIAALESRQIKKLLNSRQPDGIIGGPPCQGFSRMGKRDQADPRNTLIGHFFRHIKSLKPKFFIMENVEGLLDKESIHVLESAIESVENRYVVTRPLIINAADFGAPTNRKRVIVIGYDPKEMDSYDINEDLDLTNQRITTVKDAISDLSSPLHGTAKAADFTWNGYLVNDRRSLSNYAKKSRLLPPEGLGWKEAIKQLKLGMSSGYQDTIHTEAVRKRYESLLPGQIDPVSRGTRLSWEGLCNTLRAGTGSDKGSFQAVRPIHPDMGRVITVREAARLQGFPDWFVFHPTKWHSFRMIGNSVSPTVSEKLLASILPKISLKQAA